MEEKFVVVGRDIYKLTRRADGFFHDQWGCIWAVRDEKASLDPVDRCGVEPFALPIGHPLNPGCKPHDFAYSSPVYQAFHTRFEADQQLLNNLQMIAKGKWYSVLAKPFYWISRLRGSRYWENDKTNN